MKVEIDERSLAPLKRAITDAAAIALLGLLEFKPEGGYPEDFPVRMAWGNAEEKAQSREDLKNTPLFTEAYLYNLFGKDEARSILARLGVIARALGYEGLAGLEAERRVLLASDAVGGGE